LDAYNANPSSMKVALENFIQLENKNKVAILGDMYELGEESLAEHKYIVDFISENNSLECYFVGKDFFKNKIENSNFHFYENFEQFSNSLENKNWRNNTILIKGSRGMALERTLEYI